MFSLARYKGYGEYLPILSQLFNGDIGIIYMVYGDIGTLEGLFDEANIPYSRIHFEVDQFKARLSNVKLRKYLSKEKHMFGVIDDIIGSQSREGSLKLLKIIKNELYDIMNHYSKLYLDKHHLL